MSTTRSIASQMAVADGHFMAANIAVTVYVLLLWIYEEAHPHAHAMILYTGLLILWQARHTAKCVEVKEAGKSKKLKTARFDGNPDKLCSLLGYALPVDEYDRTSTVPDEPSTIVDMMTYVVASLPSDTNEELDEYQRDFFLKMVLRVYRSKSFGTEKWAEQHEPFFSDTVLLYAKFDDSLRQAAVNQIRSCLRHARAQMPNVSMDRLICLDKHLNMTYERDGNDSKLNMQRSPSWSDENNVKMATLNRP
jgi:hypothetical protein